MSHKFMPTRERTEAMLAAHQARRCEAVIVKTQNGRIAGHRCKQGAMVRHADHWVCGSHARATQFIEGGE